MIISLFECSACVLGIRMFCSYSVWLDQHSYIFISFIFTCYFIVKSCLTTLVLNPKYSSLHWYIKQIRSELLWLAERIAHSPCCRRLGAPWSSVWKHPHLADVWVWRNATWMSWIGCQLTCQEMRIQTVPVYDGSVHNFLTLQWCESDTHSVENILEILSSDLFPGCQYMQYNALSWCCEASCSPKSARSQMYTIDAPQCIHYVRWFCPTGG